MAVRIGRSLAAFDDDLAERAQTRGAIGSAFGLMDTLVRDLRREGIEVRFVERDDALGEIRVEHTASGRAYSVVPYSTVRIADAIGRAIASTRRARACWLDAWEDVPQTDEWWLTW